MDFTWRSTWRYVLGSVGAGLAVAFVFFWSRSIPLLTYVDLGFHELGHLIATPLPEKLYFLAGSITQIAVPLALALYFWRKRSDLLAAGLMLAWAATSAHGVSVYIADAPFQRLPLIGGQHDWAFLLGSRGWSAIHLAEPIARLTWFAGLTAGIEGIAVCTWVPLQGWLEARQKSEWDEYVSSLPRREPRQPEKYQEKSQR